MQFLISLAILAPMMGNDFNVDKVATTSPKRADKVVLSDKDWQKRLTKEQYLILRNKGTEPAFCGVNLNQKGDGIY